MGKEPAGTGIHHVNTMDRQYSVLPVPVKADRNDCTGPDHGSDNPLSICRKGRIPLVQRQATCYTPVVMVAGVLPNTTPLPPPERNGYHRTSSCPVCVFQELEL